MKKIIFILIVFFTACSNKADVPENVLPPQKMQAVLWDVMRADELVLYQATTDSSLNRYSRSIELYTKVFALHNTNAETFRRSLTFYENHPDVLQPVLDSLQSKATKINEIPGPSRAVQ